MPCKCGCKWFVWMHPEHHEYSSPTSFAYINDHIDDWPKCAKCNRPIKKKITKVRIRK